MRLNIPLIQFAKKVGSLNRKAMCIIRRDSFKKILGPKRRWKLLIRMDHILHRAISVKERQFSINGLNFKNTFLPVQDSMKRINKL